MQLTNSVSINGPYNSQSPQLDMTYDKVANEKIE